MTNIGPNELAVRRWTIGLVTWICWLLAIIFVPSVNTAISIFVVGVIVTAIFGYYKIIQYARQLDKKENRRREYE